MIKIYSAQNAVDAHIVKGLLEQQGISAMVNGEYLQGGIGELPMMGLITVSVVEDDYENAKEVVDEYESA
ncbi:MAG: DUF2007 domain-containing protein [Gammaproteobacteria bacterium]|nr:DUF2007 domain-containing protein [Gammaproteobacteria bacterium]